ncbi:MAG: MarR family winged helix-turn-helix transcriptional regulator [Solirubrobacteraceae bacterium]
MAPHGVGFLLGVAHRARRRAWEADLADLELTAPQAALLRLIAAQPGSGVRRLARDLGTDPMNVQRIAETLGAAGLCEPRQDPSDARRRPLYTTEKGRHLARAVAHRAERAEQDLIDALDVEHYHALLAGLDALVEHDRRTLDPTSRIPNGARSDETP